MRGLAPVGDYRGKHHGSFGKKERRSGQLPRAGTRVPYDAVAGLMRDGVSAERIRGLLPVGYGCGSRRRT